MSDTAQRVPVYILAGGQSSRFGQDKARVLIDEVPLILHVVRVVTPLASTLRVVADSPGKYDDLGLSCIVDVKGGCGPMSGLHRALEEHPEDNWLLLLSCDLYGLQQKWLQTLIERRHPLADAVAFSDQKWVPLPALYRTTLKERVSAMMQRDQYALWSLLQQACTLRLSLPDDWERAVHLNTQEDLRALGCRS